MPVVSVELDGLLGVTIPIGLYVSRHAFNFASKCGAEQRSAFRLSQMRGILASCRSVAAIEFQAGPSFLR